MILQKCFVDLQRSISMKASRLNNPLIVHQVSSVASVTTTDGQGRSRSYLQKTEGALDEAARHVLLLAELRLQDGLLLLHQGQGHRGGGQQQLGVRTQTHIWTTHSTFHDNSSWSHLVRGLFVLLQRFSVAEQVKASFSRRCSEEGINLV